MDGLNLLAKQPENVRRAAAILLGQCEKHGTMTLEEAARLAFTPFPGRLTPMRRACLRALRG